MICYVSVFAMSKPSVQPLHWQHWLFSSPFHWLLYPFSHLYEKSIHRAIRWISGQTPCAKWHPQFMRGVQNISFRNTVSQYRKKCSRGRKRGGRDTVVSFHWCLFLCQMLGCSGTKLMNLLHSLSYWVTLCIGKKVISVSFTDTLLSQDQEG